MKPVQSFIRHLEYCWLIYWKQRVTEQLNDPYVPLESVTWRLDQINEELQRI